jgi:hypothetical protein
MAMAGLAIGAAAWAPTAISPSEIVRSRKNEAGRVCMDSRQRKTTPDGEPKNADLQVRLRSIFVRGGGWRRLRPTGPTRVFERKITADVFLLSSGGGMR